MKLANDKFKEVIQNTPLFSIDLIVQNAKEEVLLGYRTNAPAKNHWFVPGGRVYKNETLQSAFTRLNEEELSLHVKMEDASLLGVYEHLYEDSVFAEERFSTHYIVMAMKIKSDIDLKNLPQEQHTQYQYFDIDSLLKRDDVHQNTKDYFISSKGIS